MNEVPRVPPTVHTADTSTADTLFADYARRLSETLDGYDWSPVGELAEDLLEAWKARRQVFFCGNGGSAGNAVHLANDLIYAVSKVPGCGIRAHALPANPSVLTCLANDEGYETIFAIQLGVMADPDDILVCLSVSGNSPNVLRALEEARRIGMKSYAVVGQSGGVAREIADRSVHIPIDDMQIAEDAQLIVGHMLMRYLWTKREDVIGGMR